MTRTTACLILIVFLSLGCSSLTKKPEPLMKVPVSEPRLVERVDVLKAVPESSVAPIQPIDIDEASLDEKEGLLRGLDVGDDELKRALRDDALVLIQRIRAHDTHERIMGRSAELEKERADAIRSLLAKTQKLIDAYQDQAVADGRTIRELQMRHNDVVDIADQEVKDSRTLSAVSAVVSLVVGVIALVILA